MMAAIVFFLVVGAFAVLFAALGGLFWISTKVEAASGPVWGFATFVVPLVIAVAAMIASTVPNG
ncbi:hypothetical protein IP90_00959 [Luteimonas cucumeris]|uniref:Uncharacterized protein n=1 Tax=Luteimonas cucumeris TaxID=985012 RepID=A0A562LB12_9GAMM|nr:hypothetical protein IP90_00959 [Luteimonas cucumeris]